MDSLPKTSLELDTGDWDTESDSSDESTEEPSRAFSQPPQPSSASCRSRQLFDPPAVVASKPLARAEPEERCTGVELEPFDPLNEGLCYADPAREFPEDSETFESLPGPRVVEDFTPTACYKFSDLLYTSANPEPFERSTEELSHPEATLSRNRYPQRSLQIDHLSSQASLRPLYGIQSCRLRTRKADCKSSLIHKLLLVFTELRDLISL